MMILLSPKKICPDENWYSNITRYPTFNWMFQSKILFQYNLEASGDWLGSEDEPLQGFSWRGGSARNTTGLLLWSQPFKATLSNGDKVAYWYWAMKERLVASVRN